MIGSETVAPERPAGAGYAASRIATAAPNEWPHGAALTIVGLPYVMSRASMAACPIPESILVLPQRLENSRQLTRSALAPRSARAPT